MPTIDADAHVIECEQTWSYIESEKIRPYLISPGAGRPQNWLVDGRVFHRGVNLDSFSHRQIAGISQECQHDAGGTGFANHLEVGRSVRNDLVGWHSTSKTITTLLRRTNNTSAVIGHGTSTSSQTGRLPGALAASSDTGAQPATL